MAKDARIPMRVPEALKDEFQWAAEQDGCRGISTWLRQLGEERAEQLRMNGKVLQVLDQQLPEDDIRSTLRSEAARQRRDGTPFSDTTIIERELGEPASAFVPGLGLDEEE